MKLVTVFKGWNAGEAELVRARLEAAEFHPVIVNEHSGIEMMGGGGGVLVQVPDTEAADAGEFLADSGGAPAE